MLCNDNLNMYGVSCSNTIRSVIMFYQIIILFKKRGKNLCHVCEMFCLTSVIVVKGHKMECTRSRLVSGSEVKHFINMIQVLSVCFMASGNLLYLREMTSSVNIIVNSSANRLTIHSECYRKL